MELNPNFKISMTFLHLFLTTRVLKPLADDNRKGFEINGDYNQ